MIPTNASILSSIIEYDEIGEEAFLAKYANNRRPKRHYVYQNHKLYALKALYAASHEPPIKPVDFQTYFARSRFEAMGFECIVDEDVDLFLEGRRTLSEAERISRNRGLAKRAKEKLGYNCSGCGFNFKNFYGTIAGAGYIECHHLELISSAGEGVVTIDDVDVLCSNCHRMVHTSEPPLTIKALRAAIDAAKRSN